MSSELEKKALARVQLARKRVPARAAEQTGSSVLGTHSSDRSQVRLEQQQLRELSERFGVSAIDLNQMVLDLRCVTRLSLDDCKRFGTLPLFEKNGELHLAMRDPSDTLLIDTLAFAWGTSVRTFVVTQRAFDEFTQRAFQAHQRGDSLLIGDRVSQDYLQRLGLASADLSSTESASAGEPIFDPANDPNYASRPFASVAMEMPGPADERSLEQQILSGLRATVVPISRWSSAFTSSRDARVSSVGSTPHTPLTGDSNGSLASKLAYYGALVEEKSNLEHLLAHAGGHGAHVVVVDARGTRFEVLTYLSLIQNELEGQAVVFWTGRSANFRVAHEVLLRGAKTAVCCSDSIENLVRSVLFAVEQTTLFGQALELDDDGPLLSSRVRSGWQESVEAYRVGSLDRAIGLLEEARSEAPHAFRVRYHLGLLYGKSGRVLLAVHELENAVSLRPTHFSAWKNLAVLYQQAGMMILAVDAWEHASRLAPDDASTQQMREILVGLLG